MSQDKGMGEISLLSQIPLFASLTQVELRELADRMVVCKYQHGDTIFHKGDPGTLLYVIKSGQVKITTISPQGEEIILAILSQGDFFGELALFDQEPRSASAIALTAAETFTLDQRDFFHFLNLHLALVSNILALLSRRLRRTNMLLEDSAFLDLDARLAKRLLELAERQGIRTEKGVEIELHLTQQDLAALVGASRVAVNQQLAAYQARGFIHLGKQRLIILRPEALRKIVY